MRGLNAHSTHQGRRRSDERIDNTVTYRKATKHCEDCSYHRVPARGGLWHGGRRSKNRRELLIRVGLVSSRRWHDDAVPLYTGWP